MTTQGAPPPARKSPPLLPRARVALPLPHSRMSNAPPAVPTAEGMMSTGAKMSLADTELQLRDEQLDAITAQVVAEWQTLQKKAAAATRKWFFGFAERLAHRRKLIARQHRQM
jgi:hypothetical protein